MIRILMKTIEPNNLRVSYLCDMLKGASIGVEPCIEEHGALLIKYIDVLKASSKILKAWRHL